MGGVGLRGREEGIWILISFREVLVIVVLRLLLRTWEGKRLVWVGSVGVGLWVVLGFGLVRV